MIGKAFIIRSYPTCIARRQGKVHCFSSGSPILSAYQQRVQQGAIQKDPDQEEIVSHLDRLYKDLERTDHWLFTADALSTQLLADSRTKWTDKLYHWGSSFLRRGGAPPIRGLYLYGSVGTGKSFLMDLFYHHTQSITTIRKRRRVHFHEFMLDVHQRIHVWRQQGSSGDPIPPVAIQLAKEARLLCFDEFQVTDIANAMVLQRLMNYLLELGVVVVATSNRAPRELYEGGLNRSLFMPFIDVLTSRFDVVEMKHSRDYRKQQHQNDHDIDGPSPFLWPANSAQVSQAIQDMFTAQKGTSRSETISVLMGRTITAHHSKDTTALFEFDELCFKPLGAADYLALCDRYSLLIVRNVPLLNSSRFNEARRFVIFLDALYETRTKLVMSSDIPYDQLFVDFDVHVESQDGDEETAVDNEIAVKGHGGSSSSAATTVIRTHKGGEGVEWSATGRMGVSLAQLSAVKDVSFSFHRAESRLAEMNSPSWGRACATQRDNGAFHGSSD